MAAEQRERSVEELYNATNLIGKPKITSVLKGSYRMQGPVEETERDIEKNMLSSQSEKRLGKPSMRRKVRARVESGTCNVCSAPCSSCMHLKISCMESKDDGFSDETFRGTATSQNSINEDEVSCFKDRACEASNLLSANSSQDSLSVNAESKVHLRCSDTVDTSVESKMPLKVPLDGTVGVDKLSPKQQCTLATISNKTISNKNEYPKVVEGHDDNISCISRANDVNIAEGYHSNNVDRKNLSSSSALVCSLGSEGTGKTIISPKPELLETLPNDACAGSSSPKVQSRCTSSNTNGAHLEEDAKVDTPKVSSQLFPKLEVDTKDDNGDPPDERFKCPVQVDRDEKLNVSVDLPDLQEAALQSVSGDESDESEIVEHDVKVCDICGDAGREDLLAICSKCSDGAEHTYCMREMLQKVPEGDWLCEECKLAEETENQKQDAEGKKSSRAGAQSSSKRLFETIEVASASKRLAIDTSFGSPKSSSPSKIAALSRDSSFKGLDKGKVKPAHQTSLANHSTIDSPEIARSPIGPRLRTPKGTLLKSNSFSTINSKPKVKLVDDVPQKQKGNRELDMKEGTARTMSKSMSFRSVNPSRSGATESKVKMLSSKYSQAQDIKALKQVKERNASESKTLAKLDRPVGSSGTTNSHISTLKVNQKLTPRGDNVAVSSTSNNKEPKALQSDGKLGGLLRSTSSIARKSAELPITSVRSSAMNGMSSASIEQKSNQVIPKDEPSSSSSWNAERQSHNIDENLQGLSRSRESSDQSEKTRESSVTRLRPAVTAGLKSVTCQKCKEIGHAAEFCTICSPRPSGTDTSAARIVREDMSKGSKLKAAIEAAMLRKPGIFRKKKEIDQSDGLLSSNVDVTSEAASHDQFSVSNKLRNMISDEGTDEGQANIGLSSSESCKQMNINNVKQLNVNSADIVLPLKVGEDTMVPSGGKPCHSLTATPLFSKMLTIPEHEYIWQGAFEVRRGGRLLDLHDGIQAHLSTCASPKVLEVMNQFPQKITVDEVPRLSTWPRQFHELGAKEDNIALYFFAKDLESYEKSYKNLLDNMIRGDLALKGYFGGVEFLIFPSTQLPEKSQRWNMLFFLWGVFRGRKSNCSDPASKSVTTSPNVVPVDMNGTHKPYNSLNGGLDKASGPQTSLEQQDGRLNSESLPKNATGSELWCSDIRCTPSQEEAALSECRLDTEHKSSVQATRSNNGSSSREEIQVHVDASCMREDSPSSKVFQASNQDESITTSVCEEKTVDRMDRNRDEVKVETNLNEDSTSMDIEASSGDLSIKGLDSWQSNSRKRPFLDLSETAPQTLSSTGQKMPWDTVDGESSIGKKLKSGCSEQYACSSVRGGNRLGDGFTSQICDLGSSSFIEEKSCDKAPDEKVILEDVGTTERYFFPVDSHRVKDFQLGGNSMPWKEYSSNDEDQIHEEVPNLELALGAETKPPNKGILPFFVGMVEKNNTQNKTPDKKVTDKEEEDGVSASLSLSLSFPFPDKEQTVKPVSKSEQLLPERRHVNTSLLLFRGFSDK
ncbi:uncharacterized protein LOC105632478 isoform X2 [Jatropha curcas]|uniref:uncharacterized protein LOC105632478 isoform X2 n=1 Tax=Jatropha curcas TaxID=180498 RepID=UPI0009D6B1AE|nr:uncharacterized protein LOC105632478 isoform X2 [Jatropha curcas]